MVKRVAAHCRWSGLGCKVLLLGAAFAVGLPAEAAKPTKSAGHAASVGEPAAQARRVWNAILTKCGDDYFYAGSVFDSSGILSDVQVGHTGLIEYRGVRFTQVPIRITDAERMNGLTYRGRIAMISHLYRERGEQWQDGPDLRPRNVDDMFGRVLSQANADMFDMGTNGAMALELMQFRGMWAVTRSSVDSSSAIGFGRNLYEVDKVVAARVSRYSCQAASVVAPPPTAVEIAATAAAKRKQEEPVAAAKAEDARRERVREDDIARWAFTGTPAEFRAALTANIVKRAPKFQADARLYAPEVDAIMNLVAICSAVTREDWEKAGDLDYRESETLLHGCNGHLMDSSFGTSVSPENQPRAILVQPHLNIDDGSSTSDDYSDRMIQFDISFAQLDDDPFKQQEEIPGAYLIISARILKSPGGKS